MSEKTKNLKQVYKARDSLLLVFVILISLGSFMAVVIFSHYYTLPVNETELNVLISVFAGLLGCGISSFVAIRNSIRQQEAQNAFLINQESNARKRLFLQFYVEQFNKFEEKHRSWIIASDNFIKNYADMNRQEIKYSFREIRDGIILLYRFNSIFIDEGLGENWRKLHSQIASLEQWLFAQSNIISDDTKPANLTTYYQSNFYIPITLTLHEISENIFENEKARILELQNIADY